MKRTPTEQLMFGFVSAIVSGMFNDAYFHYEINQWQRWVLLSVVIIAMVITERLFYFLDARAARRQED